MTSIVTTDALAVQDVAVDHENPPPPLPFSLTDDLALEAVDPEVLRRLKFACDQADWPPRTLEDWEGGHGDSTWCPYAFIRRNPPAGSGLSWDEDHVIHEAVACSRLVRPNGVWPHVAARLFSEGDEVVRIETPQRAFRAAYVHEPDARLWLNEAECIRLRALLQKLVQSPLASYGRVWNGRWMAEKAAQEQTVEVRLGHVVTGLESLLNTDSHAATGQFVKRVPKIADAVGVVVSRTQAEKIYADRSEAVHGAPTVLGTDEVRGSTRLDRALLAEDVLRRAVLRAIEDDAFRASFDSPAAVDAAFGA